MKFMFYGNNGETRAMTIEEVKQRLTDDQINEAVETKLADPLTRVSYMASRGVIALEIEDPRGSERW